VRTRTLELEAVNRRLDKMAHLDGLTEIPNRRRLNDYLSEVWARCAEQGRPVSWLVMDADRFKEYNDQHGHLAGDEVLKRLDPGAHSCLRRARRPGGALRRRRIRRCAARRRNAGRPRSGPRSCAAGREQRSGRHHLGRAIPRGAASHETVWALVHEVDGALYDAKRGAATG